MESPYSPPLSEVAPQTSEHWTDEIATRGDRFVATIIDGVILLLLSAPFFYFIGVWDTPTEGAPFPIVKLLLTALSGFTIYMVVNGWLLAKHGQTVGKRYVKIKIVSITGEQVSLQRILLARLLPIQLMSFIPVIGNIITLIDVLFIFRKDRRCIHDLIAGTKVVYSA